MLARSACAVVTASVLAACSSPSPDIRALMQQQYASAESQMQSMRALQDKQHLMQELMKNPDLPEWHEQRQKIVGSLFRHYFLRIGGGFGRRLPLCFLGRLSPEPTNGQPPALQLFSAALDIFPDGAAAYHRAAAVGAADDERGRNGDRR